MTMECCIFDNAKLNLSTDISYTDRCPNMAFNQIPKTYDYWNAVAYLPP